MKGLKKVEVYVGEDAWDVYCSRSYTEVRDLIAEECVSKIHVSKHFGNFVQLIYNYFKQYPEKKVPVSVDEEIQYELDRQEERFQEVMVIVDFLTKTFDKVKDRCHNYYSRANNKFGCTPFIYIDLLFKVHFCLDKKDVPLDVALGLLTKEERKACLFNLDLIESFM